MFGPLKENIIMNRKEFVYFKRNNKVLLVIFDLHKERITKYTSNALLFSTRFITDITISIL